MDIHMLQEITSNFTKELEDSRNGKKTSLEFITNTIPEIPLAKDGEVFQVMVIGGTNFFKALVKKQQSNIEILSQQHDTLPTFPDEKTFFLYLQHHLDPDTSLLAISFGFAIQPTFNHEKLEAVFMISAKESTFSDLVGKNICVEFENYMLTTYKRKLSVSMANDTICLLLSGLTMQSPQNLAAGIVGTGTNFALFLTDTTPVNLESGMFDKFPHTEFFESINQATNNPTNHYFEKEIGGGYLYMHMNSWLQKEHIAFPPLTNTQELSQLAVERQDKIGVYAQMLLARSAQLVACIIAGITNFKKSDMTFIMQGSVFWKGYHYKDIIEATLHELTPYLVSFVKIEHADIVGAAKLVA